MTNDTKKLIDNGHIAPLHVPFMELEKGKVYRVKPVDPRFDLRFLIKAGHKKKVSCPMCKVDRVNSRWEILDI